MKSRATAPRIVNLGQENVVNTESPEKRGKKISRSNVSLACRRWMVKFSALHKPSQAIILVIFFSFLLLLGKTIDLLWFSPIHGIFNEIALGTEPSVKKVKRFKNKQDHSTANIAVEVDNNQIYDRYEINSKGSVKKFHDRKTFPPLEPRMVQLTDRNHSFRFAFPPGATGSKQGKGTSFPLPEKGMRELRSRYIPLRTKMPKQMTGATPLANDAGDCEAIDPSWQLAYHPNCNQIHEASSGWQELYRMPKNDISHNNTSEDEQQREQMRLVNYGAFRHVWMIRDAHDGVTKRALKTLRSLSNREKKFDLRNHDRHRRDAISFEELRGSPFIVDLYASCSNSALFDYADKGDLLDIFEHDDGFNGKMGKSTTHADNAYKLHIMKIAYNVSMSIHDAHHFTAEGLPTMAHTDIKADQFIYQDGFYKLSDFNRVRFLTYNFKRNEQCGFKVGKNGGEYRSPEEYFYNDETEKVDVYSLGNVLFFLLTREEVWYNYNHNQAYDFVKAGQRPKVPEEIYNSDGIFERHMIRAMEAAWIHRPNERPGALQVANIIKEGLDILSKGVN